MIRRGPGSPGSSDHGSVTYPYGGAVRAPGVERGTYQLVEALQLVLQILLIITSFLVIVLVLLHKGKGGGLSDMFGGGISSGAGSSGVAERNLNRITIGLVLLWTAVVVLLGLIQRVSG